MFSPYRVFTQAQRRMKDGQLCLHGGSYCVFWLETDSQMLCCKHSGIISPAKWFRICVILRAVSKYGDGEKLCEAKTEKTSQAALPQGCRIFLWMDIHFGVNLQKVFTDDPVHKNISYSIPTPAQHQHVLFCEWPFFKICKHQLAFVLQWQPSNRSRLRRFFKSRLTNQFQTFTTTGAH